MYDIFTICTKDFKDAYEFVIDSWLMTDARKIFIFTDDKQWSSGNFRIEMVPILDETIDWMTIVGYKTMVCEYINQMEGNSVFIDIDCYLKEDLGHIFEQDFDFAVTRLLEKNERLRVSTGIIFMKCSKKLKKFMADWRAKEQTLMSKKKRPERTCSYNQDAFSKLIRKYHKEKKYKIVGLDADIYNCKMKPGMEHTIFPRLDKIKVMHFYNTSYRDSEYLKKIMEKL